MSRYYSRETDRQRRYDPYEEYYDYEYERGYHHDTQRDERRQNDRWDDRWDDREYANRYERDPVKTRESFDDVNRPADRWRQGEYPHPPRYARGDEVEASEPQKPMQQPIKRQRTSDVDRGKDAHPAATSLPSASAPAQKPAVDLKGIQSNLTVTRKIKITDACSVYGCMGVIGSDKEAREHICKTPLSYLFKDWDENEAKEQLVLKCTDSEECNQLEDPLLHMLVASNLKGPDVVIHPVDEESRTNFTKLCKNCISKFRYMKCRLETSNYRLYLVPVHDFRGYGLDDVPGLFGFVLPHGVPEMCTKLLDRKALNVVLNLDRTLCRSYCKSDYDDLLKSKQTRAINDDKMDLGEFAEDGQYIDRKTGKQKQAECNRYRSIYEKQSAMDSSRMQMMIKPVEGEYIQASCDESFSNKCEDMIYFTKHEKGKPETSRLLYVRKGWDDFRFDLCSPYFKVSVYTSDKGMHVYNAWDHLGGSKILQNKDFSSSFKMVGCKSEKKTLSKALNLDGCLQTFCPLTVIVDEQTNVWDDVSQTQILPIKPFCVYDQDEDDGMEPPLSRISKALEYIRSRFYNNFNENARSLVKSYYRNAKFNDEELEDSAWPTLSDFQVLIRHAISKYSLQDPSIAEEESENVESEIPPANYDTGTREGIQTEAPIEEIDPYEEENLRHEYEILKIKFKRDIYRMQIDKRIKFIRHCLENFEKDKAMMLERIKAEDAAKLQGQYGNHQSRAAYNSYSTGNHGYQQHPQHRSQYKEYESYDNGNASHDYHEKYQESYQHSYQPNNQPNNQQQQQHGYNSCGSDWHACHGQMPDTRPNTQSLIPATSTPSVIQPMAMNEYKHFILQNFPATFLHFDCRISNNQQRYKSIQIQVAREDRQRIAKMNLLNPTGCPNNLSRLNQMCQQIQQSLVKNPVQMDTECAFKYAYIIMLCDIHLGLGVGSDKKTAEHAAALGALNTLGRQTDPL